MNTKDFIEIIKYAIDLQKIEDETALPFLECKMGSHFVDGYKEGFNEGLKVAFIKLQESSFLLERLNK